MKYQCGHVIALSAILSLTGSAAFAQAATGAAQPAVNSTVSTTDGQGTTHRKQRHSKSRSKTKRGKAMTQPDSTLKQQEETIPPAARTPAKEVHDPADYPPGKKPPESTYKPPIDNP